MPDPTLDNPSVSTINKIHAMARFWVSKLTVMRQTYKFLLWQEQIDGYIQKMVADPVTIRNALPDPTFMHSTFSFDRFTAPSTSSQSDFHDQEIQVDDPPIRRPPPPIDWISVDVRQLALAMCVPLGFKIYSGSAAKIFRPHAVDRTNIYMINMTDHALLLSVMYYGFWLPSTAITSDNSPTITYEIIVKAVSHAIARMGAKAAQGCAYSIPLICMCPRLTNTV